MTGPRLTPQTVAVLRALAADPGKPRWGRDIAAETGLKSGTLHPILARLEQAGWVESKWEEPVEDVGRPRRRYYSFTFDGLERARSALAAAQAETASDLRKLQPQPGF